jgi:hypothetical protein
MFKLEITKLNAEVEYIYNMNSIEDDFLQFLPNNFGVPKENILAYAMPDAWKFELEAYLKLGSEYALDLGEAGKIKVATVVTTTDEVTEIESTAVTLIKEYVGTLVEWPYDENGKFDVKKQMVV